MAGAKVIDALTEGVSRLVMQRADFRSQLNVGGFPRLIEALEKKIRHGGAPDRWSGLAGAGAGTANPRPTPS